MNPGEIGNLFKVIFYWEDGTQINERGKKRKGEIGGLYQPLSKIKQYTSTYQFIQKSNEKQRMQKKKECKTFYTKNKVNIP